ncbi:MAG: DUF4160 domain-containing protein [Chitinophagaceae bacterium]
MPTLLVEKGFRFFFYSNENNEPVHVHILKADGNGKVWLHPNTEVAYFVGFSHSEQKDILAIIEVNSEKFKQKWYEYFAK